MAQVLLVEDDPALGRALSSALGQARHGVRWCNDGASALAAAESGWACELVVLDLGLPDVDGLDLCRALRKRLPSSVIVILTARDAEVDVVVGLEAGADDYLTKPIRATELLARVRAHLRRASATTTAVVGERCVGPLTISETSRRVWLGGTEIALRAKEFDLLARLAAAPGAAVSREALMADVWDEHWFGSSKTLDVHVAALRRALADAAAGSASRPPEIVTLRGFGYRLEPADGGDDVAPGGAHGAADDRG